MAGFKGRQRFFLPQLSAAFYGRGAFTNPHPFIFFFFGSGGTVRRVSSFFKKTTLKGVERGVGGDKGGYFFFPRKIFFLFEERPIPFSNQGDGKIRLLLTAFIV